MTVTHYKTAHGWAACCDREQAQARLIAGARSQTEDETLVSCPLCLRLLKVDPVGYGVVRVSGGNLDGLVGLFRSFGPRGAAIVQPYPPAPDEDTPSSTHYLVPHGALRRVDPVTARKWWETRSAE